MISDALSMEMTRQMHLAAQYLATAAKSFLKAESDDSHTNLGFSIKTNSLQTWPLNHKGIQLALNYKNFSLEWKSAQLSSFSLDGKTHQEVLDWLTEMAKASGFEKPYTYDLHYDLPYSMTNADTFQLSNPKQIQKLIRLRSLAQEVLTTFLEDENLQSTIRIWPHHFDTGVFFVFDDNSGKAVGLGLSIPDSLVDGYYFYISGYIGHDSLDTSGFGSLSFGKWINDGFKGAVLSASEASKQQALQFFKEAFSAYKN